MNMMVESLNKKTITLSRPELISILKEGLSRIDSIGATALSSELSILVHDPDDQHIRPIEIQVFVISLEESYQTEVEHVEKES
jgi:hypothetical protein